MTEIVLFHHAQGLTPGIHHFADKLRSAGHTVHTPDLYDGHVFETLDEGLAYAGKIGFENVARLGAAAVDLISPEVVYAGFSLGVMPAQMLAQVKSGARGALLFHSAIPTEEFGGDWPQAVPVQIHGMDADPFFIDEGDVDAAQSIVASAPDADLFLYPGDQHLFTDDSLPAYDAAATALVLERVLAFLARV